MKTYDLIVIGGGSGLNISSRAAREYGWKVAIIEEGPLGGTCLNRGCIPSKMLIHVADVIEEIRHAKELGITAEIQAVDFAGIMKRVSDFVDRDADAIRRGNEKAENIDVYQARAVFVDAHTVEVGDEQLSAERIVVMAGGRPFVPPIEGLDGVEYLTSTEALRLQSQPASMIVIGGGYIATELGHFFGTLGTQMAFIEKGDRLVAKEDDDVSAVFTQTFAEKYSLLMEHQVVRVSQEGEEKIVVVKDAQGNEKTLRAEALLVAVGRTPNSDILQVDRAGIAVNEHGYIVVNDFFETNQPGVWACGDIIGKAPFKHMANVEARKVLYNLNHTDKQTVDYSVIPHAIFSSPQVAGVGLTEQEAKQQGVQYEVRKRAYKTVAMGMAMKEERGFVKYIIDPVQKKILGCHILGPQASILIHEVLVALTAAEGHIDAVTSTVHIHPALSELVQWTLRD